MRDSLLVAVLLLSTTGCNTSPLSSNGSLAGAWGWDLNRNPSGSSINLSLATVGTTVTGTGEVCGIGPRACSPGSVTITGQRAGVAFQFTVRGDSGFLATYSGQVISQNELRGTWTQTGHSNTVVFHRE